jgi:hypothetical protein
MCADKLGKIAIAARKEVRDGSIQVKFPALDFDTGHPRRKWQARERKRYDAYTSGGFLSVKPCGFTL